MSKTIANVISVAAGPRIGDTGPARCRIQVMDQVDPDSGAAFTLLEPNDVVRVMRALQPFARHATLSADLEDAPEREARVTEAIFKSLWHGEGQLGACSQRVAGIEPLRAHKHCDEETTACCDCGCAGCKVFVAEIKRAARAAVKAGFG